MFVVGQSKSSKLNRFFLNTLNPRFDSFLYIVFGIFESFLDAITTPVSTEQIDNV